MWWADCLCLLDGCATVASGTSRAALRPRSYLTSGVLWADVVESRPFQIVSRHADSELCVGIEHQKEGLRQGWNLGRVRHLHDQDRTTMSVPFCELGSLKLDVLQNSLNRLADRTLSDHCVERLRRKLDLEDHSHPRVSSLGFLRSMLATTSTNSSHACSKLRTANEPR